jgi:hypothetical protein
VPSRVLVYRQQPGGGFALALTLAAGRSAQAIALGDVNADGRPDIVVGGLGGATLLRHAPRDGLEFESAVTCGRTQYAARAVRIADVDRDGLADLLVADGSQVRVLLQDRAGFPTLRETVVVPTEPQLMDFVLVDLDGDGFDDLVSLAGGGSAPVVSAAGVAVRLRDPAATVAFRAPQFYPTGQGAPVHSWRLAVADLDRDGAADVVVANDVSQTVQVEVFLQSAAARGRLRWHSGRLMGGDPTNVLAADVDGDGLLDLVAAGSKIAVAQQSPGTPLAFGTPIDIVR